MKSKNEKFSPPYAVKVIFIYANPKSSSYETQIISRDIHLLTLFPNLFGGLSGQKVTLDGKHLACRGGNEAVDLARVLFHLSAVEHALQAARLLGQLEQPLPFVLGKKGLLEGCTGGVLGLALLLPVVDFGLFTSERTLVVLEVVGLGVMSLDAVKEKVAVLLEEGVDVERQVVEVGGKDG